MTFEKNRKRNRSRTIRAAGVAIGGMVAFVLPAMAQDATLTTTESTGIPGGRAPVTVRLLNGGGQAATVQLDLLFPTATLQIDTADCTKASGRDSHLLSATLPANPPAPDGQRRLRLAILDTTPPVDLLGDGDLVTCSFRVDSGAALGSVVLDATGLQVAAADGSVVCGPGSAPAKVCGKVIGGITIASASATPTNSPMNTATKTPVPPTATNTVVPTQTRTNTVVPTQTRTNTLVPTHTITPTVTVTNTAVRTSTPTQKSGGGGGCVIVGPASQTSSPIGLLLVGAIALGLRRRSSR